MGIFKYVQGLIKIRGDSDDTVIGNVDDSLKTTVTSSSLPEGASTSALQETINTLLLSWNPKQNELMESLDKIKELIILTNTDEFNIRDGQGRGFRANVNEFGELRTVTQALPNDDDSVRQIPYTNFLTDGAGSSDARVVGSLAAPIDFAIESDPDDDIYLNSLSFRISDVNATLSQFGNIGSLSNGVQLVYSSSELGEIILADNLISNFDFVRLCAGQPSFGNTSNAFQAGNIGGPGGNSEGYIPVLNFNTQFLLNFGLRLRTKTEDKLIIRIRDDVSGVDAFDIFTTGFRKIIKGD